MASCERGWWSMSMCAAFGKEDVGDKAKAEEEHGGWDGKGGGFFLCDCLGRP